MIDIQISTGEYLQLRLNQLSGPEMHKAARAASKRAAVAARTAGTKSIRGIYTIKSSDMKSRSVIKQTEDGSIITIKGSPERVSKYQAKPKSTGIFVSVKKGNSKLVVRSFLLSGTRYVARAGKERLPFKEIYGPAVPQLFGNPQVMQAMEQRGMEVFEERLEHEIDFLMGGRA